MNQLQTLKGFRDFLPAIAQQRNLFQKKLIDIVEKYGFQPLETPTLEYAELLLGKYGTEADKLVYQFTDQGNRQVALRYDQTVPTARILTQYNQQLPKFFRRYQSQVVFRAEKPQKGRYREFLQFDIDIFNAPSHSLADAEIISCVYNAYHATGLTDIKIIVNHRETLINTLSPFATPEVPIFSIIQSIDKLDKLSSEDVKIELIHKGLSESIAVEVLHHIQTANPHPEITNLLHNLEPLGIPLQSVEFRPTLARGLDYYTGIIFEVIIPEVKGSLGGGGRYDHLIKQLGGPDIPAVGFAFGFDRTLEILSDRNLLPYQQTNTHLLLTIFNEQHVSATLAVATKLRQAGINVEIYPVASDTLSRQLKYASQSSIPFAGIIGPDELSAQSITLKNLKTAEQTTLSIDDAAAKLLSRP